MLQPAGGGVGGWVPACCRTQAAKVSSWQPAVKGGCEVGTDAVRQQLLGAEKQSPPVVCCGCSAVLGSLAVVRKGVGKVLCSPHPSRSSGGREPPPAALCSRNCLPSPPSPWINTAHLPVLTEALFGAGAGLGDVVLGVKFTALLAT